MLLMLWRYFESDLDDWEPLAPVAVPYPRPSPTPPSAAITHHRFVEHDQILRHA